VELSYALVQQQVQKLVMTPELRQAIHLLQLSTADLAEYVWNELLQNPLLEEEANAGTARERQEETDSGSESSEADPGSEDDEIDWERFFDDGTDIGWVHRPADPDTDFDPVRLVRWEPSLEERYHMELRLACEDPRILRIGQYLLGCIDGDGFFRGSVRNVAEVLGVEDEDVGRALSLIQGFEPVGVGSRSIEECLDLQICASSADERLKCLAHKIVESHLEDIAAGRMVKIATQLGVDVQVVQEAVDFIRTLNPRPGAGFIGDNEIRYIVPDVFIEHVEGEYLVVPNDSALPRLMVSNRYKSMLRDAGVEDAAKDFIKGKLNSALGLIRAVEQRRSTIVRVSESIVRHQRGFLDRGILHMRPLTLREVADDIGMHESTVSRATAGKYAQTPRGLFELRFFFNSEVGASGGRTASSASVKKRIREMIASENLTAPLTDQQISDALCGEGIRISRRTVAKYRDEMMIPPSTKRRRY
jgi:RNA polymerase sigma-54 factor